MNLIPFGKDRASGRLLDVAEVAKGEQCCCICPSCGTQLVARQGTKKEWHFAHKKDYHKGTHGPCRYSWFVALRMMIRQILSEEKELFLPEYNKHHPLERRNINVTQAKKLRYERCITDTFEKGEKHCFDAKLFVREHPLHVFVSYKGREYRGYHHEEYLEGVVEIDLRKISLVRQKHFTENSCVVQLRYMIKNPHPSKRWRYHKREVAINETIKREIAQQKKQKAAERAAHRELQNSGAKVNLQSSKVAQFTENQSNLTDFVSDVSHGGVKQSVANPPVPEPPAPNQSPPIAFSQEGLSAADALARAANLKTEEVKRQPYHCIVCKHDYMGTKEGRNPCPLCNKHLYRRAI